MDRESWKTPASEASEPPRDEQLPTPVGDYAATLTADLRKLDRVTITGELSDVRRSRVQYYFQLRDERGGVPCSMWKDAFERSGMPPELLKDGSAVIAHGGPDYYPGGRAASPAFSFRITDLRPAGEGDLLARLEALRKKFAIEGLLEPQKRLPRPELPRRIGVITAEGGAARQDLLVGLERRGWRGEIVWGFAPVQDRKAAPAITRKLTEMAALGDVEAIVVCRGGGSLTDLWAFCDEDLCRAVAMLAVPVVSAVGHERDVTLLDDVAAVRCSTPTHAADAVIPVDCNRARADIALRIDSLGRASRRAVAGRVAPLVALANGPARAIRAERIALNQRTREVRAAAERGTGERSRNLREGTIRALTGDAARYLRQVEVAAGANLARAAAIGERAARRLERERVRLDGGSVALRAHDPQRTLERGYARVETGDGESITTSRDAKRAGEFQVRFADGAVPAHTGSRPRTKPKRRAATGDDVPDDFQQTTLEGLEPDE